MEPETVVTPEKEKSRFPLKLVLVGTLVTFLLLGGIAVGVFLLSQEQEVQEKAAVPGGVAKMYITPESKTIEVGETFQANVLFDTAQNAISGLTIKLEYEFSGDEPPIAAQEIKINPTLVTDNLWDFPYNKIYTSANKVIIEIAGYSSSVNGYTTSGQESLATITFIGASSGTINVRFDEQESIIASKVSEEDILLIPQSTGTYTATGGIAPTPTGLDLPTPTATGSSGIIVGTPVSTSNPIPVTGLSTPTVLGISVGAVILIGSLFLAL